MFAASLGFWKQPPTDVSGGNAVVSGDYIVRTFTANGNLTISNGTLTGVDYLLIGGGGGGGTVIHTYRGGGGAGGVLQGSGLTLNPGTYPVVIGAKGNSGNAVGQFSNGGNSLFNGQTAIGGGYGGIGGVIAPNSGGAGGGGVNAFNSGQGAAGTAGQGFEGGDAPFQPPGGAGGGGGAGEPGYAPINPDGVGGRGGNGIQTSITGSAVYYAGGGGGGVNNSGLGRNTYGGGQATDSAGAVIAANAGVLIIRYPRSQVE